MRVKQEYMVLAFRTTTEAMAMEKRCTELELPGRLIPLPREIDAGCGLAWRVPAEQYDAEAFAAVGIAFQHTAALQM